MNTKALGDFLRHADSESTRFGRRAKRVRDLYEVCDESIGDFGQAECLNHIAEDPIVRGFLREGVVGICQAAQLENISDDRKHFYPSGDLPANRIEYVDKVRHIEDILDDPSRKLGNRR
jgi:hypothetical protein